MDIKELKSRVESNTISDEFLILNCVDETSRIVVDQYIDIISTNKKMPKVYIESISDIQDDGFIIDNNLYIINTEEWDSDDTHANCIVICNKTSNKNAIKIPALQDWQFKDFIAPKVPGLKKEELEYLYSKFSGKDKYRLLLNEIEKIAAFDESNQSQILSDMINDHQFEYVTDKTTFDFTNAIITRNIDKINQVYAEGDSVDITPMHIWTILTNSFRNIVNIQLNPKCTAEELGISDKQLYVIKKYNCNIYSKEKLIEIMSMLFNMEHMFKFEELSMNDMIDYMLVNILRR